MWAFVYVTVPAALTPPSSGIYYKPEGVRCSNMQAQKGEGFIGVQNNVYWQFLVYLLITPKLAAWITCSHLWLWLPNSCESAVGG